MRVFFYFIEILEKYMEKQVRFEFMNCFRECIDSLTLESFQEKWKQLVEIINKITKVDSKINKNKMKAYMEKVKNYREKWAYFITSNYFTACMRSTQRCESFTVKTQIFDRVLF